jgi:hypothetical protein
LSIRADKSSCELLAEQGADAALTAFLEGDDYSGELVPILAY